MALLRVARGNVYAKEMYSPRCRTASRTKPRPIVNDSDNKRHKYEIIASSERGGMWGTPGGHTCYKTQNGMCQAETESIN